MKLAPGATFNGKTIAPADVERVEKMLSVVTAASSRASSSWTSMETAKGAIVEGTPAFLAMFANTAASAPDADRDVQIGNPPPVDEDGA